MENLYEFELAESQLRKFIRNIIDNYEDNLHKLGSYDASATATEEHTIQSITKVAFAYIEDPQTLH